MNRIFTLATATVLGMATLLLSLNPALSSRVSAQSSNPANNGQALEIAPPVLNLKADPGQTIKTTIYLRNVSRGDLIVSAESNDFVAAGEDGTPKIILNNDTASNPYSMKDWVVPPAELRIVPKEIKTMSVKINVPSNASPGGHYAVLRFTARAPSVSGQGVALSASLGSLMLLTVSGDLTQSMSVQQFSASHNGHTGKVFESAPINFTVKLTNNGNVHEQPVGQITVTDMFGKKIATVNVNSPPKNVLPHSTRAFTASLDKTVIGNKKLFGRYKALLSVSYGTKQKVTSELTFWVIPYRAIAVIIGLLIVGFFAFRYALRRYNRYIVKRSSPPPTHHPPTHHPHQ